MKAAMAPPFDFDCHFDLEMTAGAVGRLGYGGVPVGNRAPTAYAAMALPFDFHFDLEMATGTDDRQGRGKVPVRNWAPTGFSL